MVLPIRAGLRLLLSERKLPMMQVWVFHIFNCENVSIKAQNSVKLEKQVLIKKIKMKANCNVCECLKTVTLLHYPKDFYNYFLGSISITN